MMNVIFLPPSSLLLVVVHEERVCSTIGVRYLYT